MLRHHHKISMDLAHKIVMRDKSTRESRRRHLGQRSMFLVAAWGLIGCSDGLSVTRSGDAGCANSCETNGWGRLIVSVVNLGPNQLPEAPVVEVVEPDGTNIPLDPDSCHDLPPPYSCTYEDGSRPGVESVLVKVRVGELKSEVTVKLTTFNRCARDVAYLEVYVESSESPRFGETKYISPCNLIGL